MFCDDIYFFNKTMQRIFLIDQCKSFLSWNSYGPFNVTGERVTKFWSDKVDVFFVSIKSTQVSSSLQDPWKCTWSGVWLESTSNELILHETTFANEAVSEVFDVLGTSFFDLTKLCKHFFHVCKLLFIGSIQSESVFIIIVFFSVVKKD